MITALVVTDQPEALRLRARENAVWLLPAAEGACYHVIAHSFDEISDVMSAAEASYRAVSCGGEYK